MTLEHDISRMPGQPMVSRRAVIVGAASALAFAAPSAKSTLGDVMPQAPVLGAVFDHGFPQSLAFAERAGSLGIEPFGFATDMSGVWFGELLPALRVDPRPIVGLTSAGALFCFEQLAWDVGMRVRLRIDHLENRDGFRHFLSEDLPSSVLKAFESSDGAFGRRALDVVLRCRRTRGNCTHASPPEFEGLRSEPLVTWLIAPLRRARQPSSSCAPYGRV